LIRVLHSSNNTFIEIFKQFTMSIKHMKAARPNSTRIAIAGAGIGGLSLAIALRRQGYSPKVFEQRAASQVPEEGIFLTLAPNGLNALRALGLDTAVASAGTVTKGIALHNEHGKQIGFIDYAKHADKFGAPSATIRRGTLLQIILSAALAEGVTVCFGRAVDGVAETASGIELRTDDVTEAFDLVVAADGLRSQVRREALPGLPSPEYNGLIGCGGIVDAPDIPPTGGVMRMIFGRKAFFGYIKDGDGPVYWFDSYPSATEPAAIEDPAALAGFLQALHADDPLDNYRIISRESAIHRLYPDYDIPSLPQWFTRRVVLLGDAAHAVTPHSGQGASMALEDAIVLAACLPAEREPIQAFQRYEGLRRARVEAAVALGRQGGQHKKAQSWLALRMRDLILPLVIPLGRSRQEKLFRFRVDRDPLVPPP
jgi:2-polyprenyl-6-methoxyphenol hydroxylase-like FAD-dependent oxidoreductase